MGIFSDLKQSYAESPGRVNAIFLTEARQALELMNARLRSQILEDFVEKREALLQRLTNMTKEGLLKTAREFQVAGNKLREGAPAEGYPLLLVGLWLESGNRPGNDAATVNQYLNELAVEHGGTFD